MPVTTSCLPREQVKTASRFDLLFDIMAEENLSQPQKIEKLRKISVLRQLREKAGLTREQLVARLGNRVALKTLQRWETSGKEPAMTREDWLDLCDALNVRWEELPRNLAGFVEEEQGVAV